MSASREKKKRQEFLTSGGVDPKAARKAQEEAAAKRSKILYTSLAVVFVVAAVFLVVYNSGFLQRSRTAVTIDGENYSATDVAYFYQDAYQGFLSTYGDMASLFGLDTTQSLKSQYAFGGTEQTWDEYFKEQAVETMRFVHAAGKAAQAEGLTLEAEDEAEIDAAIESIKTQATLYGYTYDAYLTAMYGAGMNESVLRENMGRLLLASKYAVNHQERLSFTADEVAAYYEENKNSYDLVDGAYVTISGAPETQTDANGNALPATEEETAAALEAAQETAEEILAAYEDGGDLEALAQEHGATHTADEAMTYSSGVRGDWFFDEARAAGDAEVVADETSSTYYVAVFSGRERDEALNYNVRHVLVTADSLELAEGEEATDELIAAKAQELLDSWDGTEEGFAALAEEHTQDTGSQATGGLYEDVPRGAMVSEFEDWCYADGRQAGDTGIVQSTLGQHIMYFVGYTDTEYWYYACENALMNEAYTAWETELTNSVDAQRNESGMNSVGQ